MEVGGADLEELLDNVEKYRDKIVFNKAVWLLLCSNISNGMTPLLEILSKLSTTKFSSTKGFGASSTKQIWEDSSVIRNNSLHSYSIYQMLVHATSILIFKNRKISKIHKHLKITEEQFNRFIALVQQICQHMDIPDDAITQLTSKLETFKPYLVIQ